MGPKATRWLAWGVTGLLAVGVVSAGTVAAGGPQGEVRIVTAAGDTTGALEAPTTVSAAPAAPAPPAPSAPTTASPSTTVAKPVAAPATSPPVSAPATTVPPARSTATTAPTAVTTVTPTTISGRVTVTIVSQYAYDVDVTLNDRVFRVAAGATVGPIDLALAANGNDIVEVRVVSQSTCGEGDAGGYFTAGGRYRLSIVSAGACGAIQGPTVRSSPA